MTDNSTTNGEALTKKIIQRKEHNAGRWLNLAVKEIDVTIGYLENALTFLENAEGKRVLDHIQTLKLVRDSMQSRFKPHISTFLRHEHNVTLTVPVEDIEEAQEVQE